MIKCVICGHEVKNDLSKHLNRTHNLTCKEYEEKFNQPSMSIEYRNHLSQNGQKVMTKLLNDEDFIKRQSKRMTERNKRNWSNEEYRQKMHDNGTKQWTDEYRESKVKLVTEQWKNTEIREKAIKSMKDFYATDEGIQICLSRSKPRGKKYEYNNILFRSTWEVTLAEFLDKNNIEYQYESLYFDYVGSDNKKHRYIPDFYLPKFNLIIEVKPNYWINDKINILKAESIDRNKYHYMFVSNEIINGIRSSSETIENRLLEEISNMVSE